MCRSLTQRISLLRVRSSCKVSSSRLRHESSASQGGREGRPQSGAPLNFTLNDWYRESRMIAMAFKSYWPRCCTCQRWNTRHRPAGVNPVKWSPRDWGNPNLVVRTCNRGRPPSVRLAATPNRCTDHQHCSDGDIPLQSLPGGEEQQNGREYRCCKGEQANTPGVSKLDGGIPQEESAP